MIGFIAGASTAPAVEMVTSIATMLEVRAEWVAYRGEPATAAEHEAMAREVARWTRARMHDPRVKLEIHGRPCRRQGCPHPVKARHHYCRDAWCKKLRQSEHRRRWYDNAVASEERRAALREQGRKAMQATRDRRRAAGLTGDGMIPKARRQQEAI